MTLKFRAWDSVKKEMFKDTFAITESGQVVVVEQESIVCPPDYVFVDHLAIMQSTGLFDRNGQEIFEGDILYGYAGEDFWEIVEFDTEEGKWIRKDIWYNSKLGLSENNEFMEIVGNIYENQEYLKKRGD
jgi:hypothetical protein